MYSKKRLCLQCARRMASRNCSLFHLLFFAVLSSSRTKYQKIDLQGNLWHRIFLTRLSSFCFCFFFSAGHLSVNQVKSNVCISSNYRLLYSNCYIKPSVLEQRTYGKKQGSTCSSQSKLPTLVSSSQSKVLLTVTF